MILRTDLLPRTLPTMSGLPDGGPDLVTGEITTREIIKLAHKYKSDPLIRSLAVGICNDVESMDYHGEAIKIYEFVRDNVRFRRDIAGQELIQSPLVTLSQKYSDKGIGAGDCDDHTLLILSLLLSIGARDMKCRIIKYSNLSPEWQHIYPVITFAGKEYAMDAIRKNCKFGYEAPYASKKDFEV